MTGEGVLGVLVAQVNFVALFDDDFPLGCFSGGVDLGEEDPGRGTGLGGGKFEWRIGIDLHLDFDFVPFEPDIEIEVNHLGDDSFTWFDAEEFFAAAFH
ncbi:MAG: hypothetical protein QMC23_11950 [Rubritalea sp.]